MNKFCIPFDQNIEKLHHIVMDIKKPICDEEGVNLSELRFFSIVRIYGISKMLWFSFINIQAYSTETSYHPPPHSSLCE